MREKFSAKVCEQLGCYVYLYVDPRDGVPFYIGKGTRNRAFSHMSDDAETERAERIRILRKMGLEPRIEILKYGLSEEEALLVEQTAIDLLDISKLTNIVRGHGSRHGSRAEWRVIEHELGADEIEVTEPAVLVNLRRSYQPTLTPRELYDVTRSAWKIGPKRERARLAMAVYRGVIREVYTIAKWLPGGSTMNAYDGRRESVAPDRWEFVGNLAPEELRYRYVGRRVAGVDMGVQNPIRYVNCGEMMEPEEVAG